MSERFFVSRLPRRPWVTPRHHAVCGTCARTDPVKAAGFVVEVSFEEWIVATVLLE